MCTTEEYFATPCRQDVIRRVLRCGAVFVATDYQGLGILRHGRTHPYLVSQSAGQNVLDSIRAAAELVGVDPEFPSLALGWSQGGGAALFAAELQQTYAPGLHLKGVVAVAPAADLTRLAALHDGGSRFGYLLMAAYGFRAAYPELRRYDRLLTDTGRAALRKIGSCRVEEILGEFAGRRGSEFGVTAMLAASRFQRRLAENSAGRTGTKVPILLVHGNDDDTIPVDVSRRLMERYAALGTPISTRFYPRLGHADVFDAAAADVDGYLIRHLRAD